MFVVGGESLVDLVQQKRDDGAPLMMQAHAGGSPFNCAMALGKLGNATGFLCPISKDGFGEFLTEPLKRSGAQALLTDRVDAPTTLAVVTLNERGQAQYEFYRGADRALDETKLIKVLPERPFVYQIGGFCPIEPKDASVWLKVVREAKARGAVVSIDPNVRPSLVDDFEGYKDRLDQFLGLSNIVKLSSEDLEELWPDHSLEEQVKSVLSRDAVELVVVTDGENGSKAFTHDASASHGIYAPEVFGDTVGAGDTLMAGILTWLHEQGRLATLNTLSEPELLQMLKFGAVAAGINCSRHGCVPPSRSEVDVILKELD